MSCSASRSSLLSRWRRHALPVAAWLAGLVGVGALLNERSAALRVVGLAGGRICHISPVAASRVRSIHVELFQQVRQGQTVAVMDDSVLAAQVATISAEVQRLRAEFEENRDIAEADRASRLSEWVAEHRAFTGDVLEISMKIGELRTVLETDRVMLRDLQLEVDNAARLVESKAVPRYELEKATALHDAMAGKIAANERLLRDWEAQQALAATRRDEYRDHLPAAATRETAAEHLRRAIEVQEGLIRELEAQRADCVLRAPFDGVVVQIQGRAAEEAIRRPGEGTLRRPGEVVNPGEPVVTIAEAHPTEVLAYVADEQAATFREGMEVDLRTLGGTPRVARSRIAAVGPTVERMPERLWPNPTIPAWGRPLLVPIPPGLAVRSGEVVTVCRP